MAVGCTRRQIIDPTLPLDQTDIFAQELITVPKRRFAAKHKKLGTGTSEGNIDSSPITQ
jgi:hypothetical protein